jgi:hypothetical protein
MYEFKRTGLVVLQLMVVLATVASTIIMFLHPACIEHMLAEVARGIAAGVLFASVKALVKISRPSMVCKPMSSWWRYWRAVTWHELKCSLATGYLLGLMMAMWACWNG